jgi:hypothetical protein
MEPDVTGAIGRER